MGWGVLAAALLLFLRGCACDSLDDALDQGGLLDHVRQLAQESTAIGEGCEESVVEPRGSITMTPAEFAFSISGIDSLKSCRQFSLTNLMTCSNDLGRTTGCCDTQCTEMLSRIHDDCWNALEGMTCATVSNQTAVVLDLLVRRCGVQKRDIWCTESCEDRHEIPTIPLLLSNAEAAFEVAHVDTPEVCGSFQFANLTACAKDVNVESGCCSTECTRQFKKVTDQCFHEVAAEVCGTQLNQTAASIDLLFRRCDPHQRTLNCDRPCVLDNLCEAVDEQFIEDTKNGNVTAVDQLLELGADIETRDDNGFTPLMWATYAGHVSLVEFFLSRGADINATDDFGGSAVHLAVYSNSTSIVSLLVEEGADADGRDYAGWSPLHHAVGWSTPEVVKALLLHGANISSVTLQDVEFNLAKDIPAGSTALHIAAQRSNKDALEVLLNNDPPANKKAQNSLGSTPRDVVPSEAADRAAILKLLE